MYQDVPHTTEASNRFERAVCALRARQRGGHLRQAVKPALHSHGPRQCLSAVALFCLCCYHGFPRGEQNEMQILDPGVIHLPLCLGLVSHSQDHGCGEFRRSLCRVDVWGLRKQVWVAQVKESMGSVVSSFLPSSVSAFRVWCAWCIFFKYTSKWIQPQR